MYWQEIVSYTISFFLVTLIGVYGVNLPGIISGNQTLVNLYYYDNMKFFIPFDYFLILIYFLAAYYVNKMIDVRSRTNYLLVIICTTILISGGFMLYFLSKPLSSSFFSQWFHAVSYKAVIYDIILLSLIYIVYVKIYSYITLV
jgi:hypothetical protein